MNRLDLARSYIDNAKTSQENKEILKEYLMAGCLGERCKIKKATTLKSEQALLTKVAEQYNKSLRDLTKLDIKTYLYSFEERGLKASTRILYSIIIKQFYTWLDEGKHYEKVEWIKGGKTSRRFLDHTKLLMPSDIENMVLKCSNSRDKALVIGLYESASRVSEFLGIKIKDILFDDYGCKIKVNGKTGQRNIRLIDATPYFHRWLEEHPYKKEHDKPFFINFATNYYGEQLSNPSFGKMLKTIAKRANISKHIHPHLFRHSKLTWLAQNEGFNERDLRIYAGWSAGSDMPNTYLHYGEEEVDKKLRIARGLTSDKDSRTEKFERKVLNYKICPRCNKNNTSDALYCNCGQVLDINEAQKIEDLKQRAINQAMEEFMKIANDSNRIEKFNEFQKNII